MQIRQIVLDTETTGLFPHEGHRIIEIAAVELINGEATGNHYHIYLNPKRDSHPEALKVHGLTTEFLADKPEFSERADAFLKFTDGAEFIIHNAPFDMGFLNHELNLIGKPALTHAVVDTKVMAQGLYTKEFLTTELVSRQLVNDEKLVQEQKATADSDAALITGLVANSKFRVHSLDHLCQYYGVNLSAREKHHGALIDCELLSQVYFHLKQEQAKREISQPAQLPAPTVATRDTTMNNRFFNANQATPPVSASASVESEAEEKQTTKRPYTL